MSAWPFRSPLRKAVFVASLAIMLAAALIGLISALVAGEFSRYSIAALTTGIGALLITASIVLVEMLSRKFHPESGLFTWSDVDNLRALAAQSGDADIRSWALSLAHRIAVVLPGRPAS